MKHFIANLMITTLLLSLGVAIAQAQNRTRPVSLGEVARRLKAQHEKSAPTSRVFTNDDLVAQPKSDDPSAALPATTSSTSSSEAKPEENSPTQTNANQTGKEPAGATQAETIEEKRGENYHRDPMSKLQDGHEGKLQASKVSPSPVRPAKHPAAPAVHARLRGARHSAASAPIRQLARTSPRPAPKVVSRAGALRRAAADSSSVQPPVAPRPVAAVSKSTAKANPLPAPKVISRAGAPRPVATVSSSSPSAPRQDLGYVEKADGRVEAIVADGTYVRLVQETKSFARNFRVPASSSTNVGAALVSPPPTNPPATPGLEADSAYSSSSTQDAPGSPAATAEVAAALVPQPAPVAGDKGGSESTASATLQSEPLADYASDQSPTKPPETLQVSPAPVLPAMAPEAGVNHSTVQALGYVEKAGGEREAIVEVLGQVYLVHEGELFADKYRALRVTPTSVEVVEEPTEASAALPERRRKVRDVRRPLE